MESNNIDDELQKLEKLSKDTAVGDTMYDKKSVIEKILEVGKHFQQTSYIRDEEVLELETGIEEKLCTLWDISVEEDVRSEAINLIHKSHFCCVILVSILTKSLIYNSKQSYARVKIRVNFI